MICKICKSDIVRPEPESTFFIELYNWRLKDNAMYHFCVPCWAMLAGEQYIPSSNSHTNERHWSRCHYCTTEAKPAAISIDLMVMRNSGWIQTINSALVGPTLKFCASCWNEFSENNLNLDIPKIERK